METDGGGWTVIQRRNASLGRVNFVRDWKNYENGFGDLDGEYWIGLNNIYELTNQQRMKLRMTVWNDTSNSIIHTWDYPFFQIFGSSQKYALKSEVGPGNGEGSYGPLPYVNNNNRFFSTFDRDYDQSGANCAYTDQGGWWYYDCN